MKVMAKFEIFVDGASKGNPGPSGVGVAIYQDHKLIKEISDYIGDTTNNIAEYTALIHGLEEMRSLKADSVSIKTDSQLMYRQLKKEYKVRDPRIAQMYSQAWSLIQGFKEVSIKHIPREENSAADMLATKAVKDFLARQKAATPPKAERKVRAPGGSVAGNTRPVFLVKRKTEEKSYRDESQGDLF